MPSSPAMEMVREPAPFGDATATFQTGGRMAQLVQARSHSPRIHALALQAIAGLPPGATRQEKADAVYRFVQSRMRLVPHEELACRFAGRCDGDAQFLMDPELALELGEGDCAIYTPLVCALLFSIGVPCRMIAVGADERQPGRFSHVYAAAVLEDRTLYPLDASHGLAPGWETPSPSRFQVWTIFGLPLW